MQSTQFRVNRYAVCLTSLLAVQAVATLPAVGGNAFSEGTLVVSPGKGTPPAVRLLGSDGTRIRTLSPFNRTFQGGVQVAVGDVTGDGYPDMLLTRGAPSTPIVEFLDGETLEPPRRGRQSVTAFDGEIRHGLYVAAGDVDGDGRAEVIVGTGGGPEPLVQVLDSLTNEVIAEARAYGSSTRGGVFVAAGDLDGDGKAEVVTGSGQGGGPKVKVFDGRTGLFITSFDAYRASYRGGIRVAVGDVNNDGVAEIITSPGPGLAPNIRIFSDPMPRTDGLSFTRTASFPAYDTAFRGGVSVAVANLDDDPEAEIVTVPVNSRPVVKVFDGAGALQTSFLGLDRRFRGSATLAIFGRSPR